MTVTVNAAQARALSLILNQYPDERIRLGQEPGTRKPIYVTLPQQGARITVNGAIRWGERAPA